MTIDANLLLGMWMGFGAGIVICALLAGLTYRWCFDYGFTVGQEKRGVLSLTRKDLDRMATLFEMEAVRLDLMQDARVDDSAMEYRQFAVKLRACREVQP